MKKYISLLLVSVLILLSGCGMTVTKVENTTAESGVTTTDPETVTTTASFAKSTTSYVTTTSFAASSATTKTAAGKTSAVSTTAKSQKTTSATTKKQVKSVTCTIEIECKTILNNLGNLRPEKKTFLPKDGYILRETTVSVAEGSTVFDVLKKVCKEHTCPEKCTYCRKSGIQLEYVYTPGYDSEYIRGIHQLYEKDCGTQSGWMYSVNGVFPNYGVNKYTVKNGDNIKLRYTCNGLGEDIGAEFMG